MRKKTIFLLRILILISCVLCIHTNRVNGQTRFKAEDIVTYSDCRNSYMADFSPRYVFFSSENGIWRLDRYTGKMADPVYTGLGIDQAVDLRFGDVLLWHDESSTLWLWSERTGLKYYRWDISKWFSFPNISKNTRVNTLGETSHLVLIHIITSDKEPESDMFIHIDPQAFNIIERSDLPPDNVRWAGLWKQHPFKHYWIDDSDLRFYSEDGRIQDKYNRRFKVSFDLYDDMFERRYICYPGLGIGVANERHQSMEIIQPGPAGKDVRCLEIMKSGFTWICGINGRNAGINLFDRKKGEWQFFDSDYVNGIESHRVSDIAIHKTSIYFASDEGLVTFRADKGKWKTYDRFSGLSGLELRALGKTQNELFIGGDYGLNRMELPKGVILPAGDRRVNDLRTADIVTDGDTVWVAGLQGIFRYEPDEWQRIGDYESIVGDEAGRCLAVTDNFLWVGGERGIRELNRKTGEWRGWLSHVYLDSASPRALAAYDSMLWIGTNRGLHTMHLRKRSWLSYGKREGLPSDNIQCLEVEADTLWIGSPEGITRFLWNRPARDVF